MGKRALTFNQQVKKLEIRFDRIERKLGVITEYLYVLGEKLEVDLEEERKKIPLQLFGESVIDV